MVSVSGPRLQLVRIARALAAILIVAGRC